MKHKKFFSKAKDAAYLKQHFIKDLKEVYQRKDQSLILQAEEYMSTKVRARVKRIELETK